MTILVSALTHAITELNPTSTHARSTEQWLASQEWLQLSVAGAAKHPFSIIKQAALHLEEHDDTQRRRWVEQETWTDLEAVLRSAMRQVRPLVIVFDEFDKYPIEDPSLLAEVQAGLAMFLSDYSSRALPNLRIRAAVDGRALRFAERHNNHTLQRSESVAELIWSKAALRNFLFARLRSGGATGDQPLAWLVAGDLVPVPERRVNEDPIEYLLRHSSLSAGDLDYHLAMLIQQRRTAGTPLPVEEFRAAVADNSVHLARTRLRQAAEEFAAFSVTSVAVRDFANVDRQLYIDAIRSRLEGCPQEVLGRLRFNRNFLDSWYTETRSYMLNILWWNAVIAIYPTHSQARLLPRSIFNEIRPTDRRIAINPILHDLVPLRLAFEEVRLDYR